MADVSVRGDGSVARGRRAAAPVARPRGTAVLIISWVALAFMTTGSVASLRSTPSMAVYGLSSIFLYIVPAIVFLLPTALVAAELASGWSGGVYNWVTQGISAPLGFLAVWNQFAMTIFYYPSLLAYVASTFAYVINPKLASNGIYVFLVIVGVYWLGVFVSSHGMKAIAGLSSGGLVVGTLIPGAALIILGIVFLFGGNTPAAPMDASHLLPPWAGIASLVLIVNNFLAYAGMEMNAVHVNELRDPVHEFPRAMFLATGLVLVIFIVPTLAISWVVPTKDLSLTAGVMQAFSAFFGYFGVPWMVPVVALMLICASLGGMLAWLAGPSKGLLLIGRQEGYLPLLFQRLNRQGIQVNILMTQGAVTTIIALLYAFIPNVSSAYWIFSVMTTQCYLIMYVLMFFAAYRLRRIAADHPRGYRAPAMDVLCIVGLIASVLAFAIGFIPPSQFGSANTGVYVLIILVGVGIIGLLIPWLFLRLRKPSWKTASPAEESSRAPAAGS